MLIRTCSCSQSETILIDDRKGSNRCSGINAMEHFQSSNEEGAKCSEISAMRLCQWQHLSPEGQSPAGLQPRSTKKRSLGKRSREALEAKTKRTNAPGVDDGRFVKMPEYHGMRSTSKGARRDWSCWGPTTNCRDQEQKSRFECQENHRTSSPPKKIDCLNQMRSSFNFPMRCKG